jgi:hypothetical protein
LSLLQIRFFENIVSYSRPKEYIAKPKIQIWAVYRVGGI